MPNKRTIDKARRDARAGKSASTQASEFVHDEIEKVRHGEHGARSAKQAIAIGLSEARRAGVGGKKKQRKTSARRSKAALKALKREPRSTVSKKALSKQAKSSAAKRGAPKRKAAARKAARTCRAK